MNSKKFDINNLRQYDEIFGREKMLKLFSEYQQKAENDLSRVSQLLKNEQMDELRLIYHSLRSSSQVFGMMAFSSACEDMEEKILGGEKADKLDKLVWLSRKLYEQELAEVITFLK